MHMPDFVARSVLANVLGALCLTPAQAETPGGEAFVAAFGEVCIPERLSYKGTVALAEKLGWQHVVPGENADYDRFIAHSDALLAGEVAEDPDRIEATGNARVTREVGELPHPLPASCQRTQS